nr:PREDICTED: lysine-specific demethylase 4D-like [Bemisia tabaci]
MKEEVKSKKVEEIEVESPLLQKIVGTSENGCCLIHNKTKRAQKVSTFRDAHWEGEEQNLIKEYWQNQEHLKKGKEYGPFLYGADIMESIYTTSETGFHIDEIPSLLTGKINEPGVDHSYSYFGTKFSSFAWHREDMCLYSINHHLEGAPKIWYTLPATESEKFELFLHKTFPEANYCKGYSCHKRNVVSPQILEKNGFHPHMIIQRPGEIVITIPNGYHGGFNIGYNWAIARNFATPGWYPFGVEAKTCSCGGTQSGFKFDMAIFNAEELQPGPSGITPTDAQIKACEKCRNPERLIKGFCKRCYMQDYHAKEKELLKVCIDCGRKQRNGMGEKPYVPARDATGCRCNTCVTRWSRQQKN